MKEYIIEKNHYYGFIKNNTVVKLFCKKLQLKGNCFSIKKRLFRRVHFDTLVNFEILFIFNILKIISKVLREFVDPNRILINLNIFNIHNFIYIILSIFKVIRNHVKYTSGKVDLNDYFFYNFNELKYLLFDINFGNILNKLFFRKYFRYINKFYKYNYRLNVNFHCYRKFFIRRVYRYKFVNRCLVNSSSL